MRRHVMSLILTIALAGPAAAQEVGTPEQQRTAAIITTVALAATVLLPMAIPPLIALVRRHPDLLAITALSIITGWTCIGWVIAVVWALKSIPRDRR